MIGASLTVSFRVAGPAESFAVVYSVHHLLASILVLRYDMVGVQVLNTRTGDAFVSIALFYRPAPSGEPRIVRRVLPFPERVVRTARGSTTPPFDPVVNEPVPNGIRSDFHEVRDSVYRQFFFGVLLPKPRLIPIVPVPRNTVFPKLIPDRGTPCFTQSPISR